MDLDFQKGEGNGEERKALRGRPELLNQE